MRQILFDCVAIYLSRSYLLFLDIFIILFDDFAPFRLTMSHYLLTTHQLVKQQQELKQPTNAAQVILNQLFIQLNQIALLFLGFQAGFNVAYNRTEHSRGFFSCFMIKIHHFSVIFSTHSPSFLDSFRFQNDSKVSSACFTLKHHKLNLSFTLQLQLQRLKTKRSKRFQKLC